MAIKKIQREEIEQSPREKLVIYKSLGDFKITPESNFKASVQNARQIIDLKDFDTVDEIIDYYKRWFHSADDDFIIDDSAKETLEESLKLITAYTNLDEKEKALAEWIYEVCPPNADRELNAVWADAVPSYDEVIKKFDSEIRKEQYEKVKDALIDAIKDVNYYDMYLELSDRPVAKEMGSLKLSADAWEDIKDKYLKKFEEITGVQAWSYGANGKHVVVEDDLTNLFGYNQMKVVLKELQDEMIQEVNDYDETFDPTKELKNNVIEIGDKVLYVFYNKKNNKLCAGSATNAGIIPEYEIDYDVDASLDANLATLMDKIQEDVGDEGIDFGESLGTSVKQEDFEQDVAEEWGKKAYLLNSIISSLNNEDAYYGEWICEWPDGTREEDTKYYFETEADYDDLFKTFEKVYREYHDDGLVTTDKNIISASHEFDKEFGLTPIEIL